MYIDTRAQETMQQSICKSLEITIEELDNLFFEAKKASVKEYSMDMDKFNIIINEFIDSKVLNQTIEQILFFHLGRRLNIANDCAEGKNLFELLSNESAVSVFLKNHAVTFQVNTTHLELFYKGKLISLDDAAKEHVPYLRWRMGHNSNRVDYCFNGFMLRDLLVRNDYARSLFSAPEFIGVLSNFLGNRDIVTDYVENSKYYCYEYLVPIDKVFFDDAEELSKEGKQRYLLNKVLCRLFEYTTKDKNMFDHDNPVLRLADNEKMAEQYFIKKEEITWEMLR
ncbi:hypothetical protein [Sporosarcina aquimarina]|uniref:hypothetical protein n=1 Tax=Sporosarcina aquimarina TaxID=114975 RepID=UPI001C8DE958|nr:hypothetical protein [Sporosarcina aquimarina]MBY0221786.1 hypothetical protein [Sporosarcina aquimarina]